MKKRKTVSFAGIICWIQILATCLTWVKLPVEGGTQTVSIYGFLAALSRMWAGGEAITTVLMPYFYWINWILILVLTIVVVGSAALWMVANARKNQMLRIVAPIISGVSTIALSMIVSNLNKTLTAALDIPFKSGIAVVLMLLLGIAALFVALANANLEVHLTKRVGMPIWESWLIRIGAVLIALLLSGLFILSVTGLNPIKVYGAMYEGALGTTRKTWFTIRDTMMLLCISIGLAPAFKMKFWNIGAEGQVLVGGIVTAGLMINLGNGSIPTWLLLVIMAIVSIVAGAIWGVIPAIFKARWGTNETLFTLMMNYIAIRLTAYWVACWENPFGSNSVGVINRTTKIGWFPKVFGQNVGLNVVIVLALAVGMFIYLKYSKQGYEITVLGESENTARYAGMKPAYVIIRTMAISGAICGIAGFIAVAGASHTISISTAGGQGFTAIIVAWLAKFNSFVMMLISFILAFLQKGAMEIASQFKLNDFASNVITGIILFCIIASEFFINYRVVVRKRKEAENK